MIKKTRLSTLFVLATLMAGGLGCKVVNSPLALSFSTPEPERIENLSGELIAAQELLDQNKSKKAVKLLTKWIKNNPDSESLDQGWYLKGQAYFDRKLYHNAYYAYEELLNGFSTSDLREASLRQEMEIARRYMVGEKRIVWRFLPIKAHNDAVEILDGIIEKWPLSELSAQALMMQGDYYFHNGRFLEAESTYQLMVDHYRNSRYYEMALLSGAESSHAQYQGPKYDSGCLTEARFKYERYRVLFPDNAEKFGITQRIERINWQEGEKKYLIGDYYWRTGKMGAARYYFEYIIQRWPGGEWALKAENMLQNGDIMAKTPSENLPAADNVK